MRTLLGNILNLPWRHCKAILSSPLRDRRENLPPALITPTLLFKQPFTPQAPQGGGMGDEDMEMLNPPNRGEQALPCLGVFPLPNVAKTARALALIG